MQVFEPHVMVWRWPCEEADNIPPATFALSVEESQALLRPEGRTGGRGLWQWVTSCWDCFGLERPPSPVACLRIASNQPRGCGLLGVMQAEGHAGEDEQPNGRQPPADEVASLERAMAWRRQDLRERGPQISVVKQQVQQLQLWAEVLDGNELELATRRADIGREVFRLHDEVRRAMAAHARDRDRVLQLLVTHEGLQLPPDLMPSMSGLWVDCLASAKELEAYAEVIWGADQEKAAAAMDGRLARPAHDDDIEEAVPPPLSPPADFAHKTSRTPEQVEEERRRLEGVVLAALKQTEEERRKEQEALAAERARVAAEEAAAALVRELEAEEAANQARHNKKQEKRRKDKDRQRQQRQQEEQARAEALAAQEEQRRRKKEGRLQRRQQEAEMKAQAEQQDEPSRPGAKAAGEGKGQAMVDGGGILLGKQQQQQVKDQHHPVTGRQEEKEEEEAEASPASFESKPGRAETVVKQDDQEAQGRQQEGAMEEVEGGLSSLDMEDHLSCPISLVLMTDPVVAADGNTYQRDAIQAWIHRCTAAGREVTSPLSGLPMAPELKPNNLVRCLVLESTSKRGGR